MAKYVAVILMAVLLIGTLAVQDAAAFPQQGDMQVSGSFGVAGEGGQGGPGGPGGRPGPPGGMPGGMPQGGGGGNGGNNPQ